MASTTQPMTDDVPTQSDARDPFNLMAGTPETRWRAADAPPELQSAADALRAAHREYMNLADQLALWKTLATDQDLLTRLGPSEVAQAVLTMRHALLSAIVLGISRMTEKGRGKLNVFKVFEEILRYEAWLRRDRESYFAKRPVILCGDQVQSEAEAAALTRMVQQSGTQRAIAAFDEQLEKFRAAKERFTKGHAWAALERLQEMRNKEIAHNDFRATLGTERPKMRDLDLVFHTLRGLLYNAISLCIATDIDSLRDEQDARRAALCLGAVLRPETAEERAAASARAKGAPG